MQNAPRGISGVPFYIINNQYGVSGAQPSEIFTKALLEISTENVSDDQACDVESKEC
jgi:predicted DsbA family dithiol-disulfide isomerase